LDPTPEAATSRDRRNRPANAAAWFAAKWAEHAEAIRESVREAPDATLEEHRQRLCPDVGVSAT